MTINRPGLPGDLPEPRLLWARWAFAAVLTARTEDEDAGVHRTGYWVNRRGVLRCDDAGSTRWWFSRAGEGRWVLYGQDESSDAEWHEPPVDLLAGAPGWLPVPELRDLIGGHELGCVYWWENGAWARTGYPDGVADDGLDCGMSRFTGPGRTLDAVTDWNDLMDAAAVAAAAGLLAGAEAWRLTPEDLRRAAADPQVWDLPAMLRTLAATGLSGGAEPARPVPA